MTGTFKRNITMLKTTFWNNWYWGVRRIVLLAYILGNYIIRWEGQGHAKFVVVNNDFLFKQTKHLQGKNQFKNIEKTRSTLIWSYNRNPVIGSNIHKTMHIRKWMDGCVDGWIPQNSNELYKYSTHRIFIWRLQTNVPSNFFFLLRKTFLYWADISGTWAKHSLPCTAHTHTHTHESV